VILAAFTYSSGLRPASIAIVKDILIYVTAFAAVIFIPIQLGGFEKIFAAVPPQKLLLASPATQYAIYLQLLGGIWIIQTLPAVLLGAYTRWFNPWALLIGWLAGIFAGTAMAIYAELKPTFPLEIHGYTFPGYTALYTVILNLAVTIVLTLVFSLITFRRPRVDETLPADYFA
jgi:Na+/proline symporter